MDLLPCRLRRKTSIRVFLAAYMVAYFPSHVFETMGPLEQALFDAATPMIVAFEAIMGELTTCGSSFRDVPYALTKDFPTLLFEFLRYDRVLVGGDLNDFQVQLFY